MKEPESKAMTATGDTSRPTDVALVLSFGRKNALVDGIIQSSLYRIGIF